MKAHTIPSRSGKAIMYQPLILPGTNDMIWEGFDLMWTLPVGAMRRIVEEYSTEQIGRHVEFLQWTRTG